MAAHVEEAVGKEVVILQAKIKECVLQKHRNCFCQHGMCSSLSLFVIFSRIYLNISFLGMICTCRLGTLNEATGKWEVPFGKLYDETVDIFEALAGTLKAAKKRKVVDYGAPLLLKGA